LIGRTLAQYTVLEKIGEGGMGEVWKARDTALNREVAIKVLPEAFAQDRERLARFEREAQLLAALNHPNLATVHGLHEERGIRFLAMEWVPGGDLARRLSRGPVPVQDALEIAAQVAAALEAAHDQGVVHRDLKPSNVMVTPDGKAKVLDFGLAFSMVGESGSGPGLLSQSPTIASPITAHGVILGTAAYMSPEQARGKPVDRRTDMWAFGCVLYEMLTGHLLFAGETVSDCVARILTAEPDWDRLPAETPSPVRKLIRRCLTRDPARRQQGAGDARVVLEEVLRGEAGDDAVAPGGAAAPRARRKPWLVPAAVALGCVLGALGWSLLRSGADGAPTGPPVRLSVVIPDDLRASVGLLSPDGETFAITARPVAPKTPDDEKPGIYLRRLDRYGFRFVPGSRGVSGYCFSTDGRWLAMVAPAEPTAIKNFVWKVPVDGSAPPLKLLDWSKEWLGLHWLPDGDLIVGTRALEVLRLPTDGRAPGSPVPIHGDVEPGDFFPPLGESTTLLPNGHHLLSSVEHFGQHGYSQAIVVLDILTGEIKQIQENGANPRWSDTGHLLFGRGTSLLAVPFDPARLEETGGPTALVGDLRIDVSWAHGSFRLARNGTLLYVPGGWVGGQRRLVWLDHELNEIAPWSDEVFPLEIDPIMSPDGSRFVVGMAGDDGVYDIWMSEPNRPILQKWWEEPGRDVLAAAWSRDGSRIAYLSRTNQSRRYYVRPLDGAAEPVLILEDTSPDTRWRASSFADGDKLVLFTRTRGEPDIVSVPVDPPADGPPSPTLVLSGASNPILSPDGRWMSYETDASGRSEIYLRRWKGGGTLGPERRISTDGGSQAFWYTPGGRGSLELRFFDNDRLYAVPIGSEEAPVLPRPRFVSDLGEEYLALAGAPDGRILAIKRGDEEGPPHHVSVIPGWSRELKP